jgi:hypothetical protein
MAQATALTLDSIEVAVEPKTNEATFWRETGISSKDCRRTNDDIQSKSSLQKTLEGTHYIAAQKRC